MNSFRLDRTGMDWVMVKYVIISHFPCISAYGDSKASISNRGLVPKPLSKADTGSGPRNKRWKEVPNDSGDAAIGK